MDKFTPEQRSKIMSAIHSRDTLPEIVVRKWLYANGYRFRVCDKRIVGHPDIVLPKYRTLIEVRGCFWHQHGCAKCSTPKSNIEFWTQKWDRNISRDERHETEWRELGWNVIIVWECALEPVRREETLQNICLALDLWKNEEPLPKKRPRRLELPFPRK